MAEPILIKFSAGPARHIPFIECPTCGTYLNMRGRSFHFTDDGSLSVTSLEGRPPSIKCIACGAHFHIRDNNIEHSPR